MIRRIVRGAALVLALSCLLPIAQARDMVSVDRAEINMREGPGTDHPAIWVLARGYPLQVLRRTGKWLRVRDFEGDRGWVYRALTGTSPHYVVRVKVANIRSAPGTRNRIVGKAQYGEILKTLGHRRDWARVRNDEGLTGWISRRLLWGW